MLIITYECPHCKYLDSDEEMAANHCLDNKGHLW